MEHLAVKRYGLILAKQAEIDGMKAENSIYLKKGLTPKYGEADFLNKAADLENLSYAHEYQLFG